jgi:hypothetical protein
MTSLRARALLVAPIAALALVLVPAVAASAHEGGSHRHHGGHTLLRADLTPSTPTDAPIFGVKPGGAPWVLRDGDVRVRADGRIRVELRGLQIPRADGTKDNPVASIVATLFCSGAPVAHTDPQPLSVPAGDARFRSTLAGVPSTCDMATVLISPAANTSVYIASAMVEADND